MQTAYIGKLMEIAEKDSSVFHVLSDSGTGYDSIFRRYFPKQIYEFGIAEQNAVAAAAGMAAVGKMPFVFTAGAFLIYRAMEFIRNDICFQNLNVKMVGTGSGLSNSTLGPTHHTTEDIAILRVIPNLMILSPATPRQAAECTEMAYKHKGPVFIRMGMNREKEYFDDNYSMNQDGYDEIRQGKDIVIFSTGTILDEADKAVDLLKKEGIDSSLISITTLKPINEEIFIEKAKHFNRFYSIEEHQESGGMGSIISEIIVKRRLNTQLTCIGLKDSFSVGYGDYREVRRRNELNAKSIYKKIKESIN